VAVEFYDELMPLLGFGPEKRSSAVIEAHDLHVVEYSQAFELLAMDGRGASTLRIDDRGFHVAIVEPAAERFR
jgi:hypothetical protein